jgi:hypothetical protein
LKALLTARGTRLQNITEIPSDTFRPESTTIPFSVEIPDVSLNLSLPRWNTWALHAPKDGHNLAKVRVLKLDGFFRYFSEVREDNVEQLKLTITVRRLLPFAGQRLTFFFRPATLHIKVWVGRFDIS